MKHFYLSVCIAMLPMISYADDSPKDARLINGTWCSDKELSYKHNHLNKKLSKEQQIFFNQFFGNMKTVCTGKGKQGTCSLNMPDTDVTIKGKTHTLEGMKSTKTTHKLLRYTPQKLRLSVLIDEFNVTENYTYNFINSDLFWVSVNVSTDKGNTKVREYFTRCEVDKK